MSDFQQAAHLFDEDLLEKARVTVDPAKGTVSLNFHGDDIPIELVYRKRISAMWTIVVEITAVYEGRRVPLWSGIEACPELHRWWGAAVEEAFEQNQKQRDADIREVLKHIGQLGQKAKAT